MAARICMASSSQCPWATMAVRVTAERIWRLRPGLVQMPPQAIRVIMSWKSSVKESLAALARSTCSAPSTSRRTTIPPS